MRLRFRSDTSWIKACFRYGGQARPIFAADIFVDGRPAETFGPDAPTREWSGEIFRAEVRTRREFDLWLPHVVETWVEFLEMEDGAEIEPVPAGSTTWVAAGDSITQGMAASIPSRTFSAVAARSLKFNLHNTGVGGATMEQVAGMGASLIPCSFATVAFGVNDWAHSKPGEQFEQDTVGLLSELLRGKSNLPVGLLTPLPVLERDDLASSTLRIEDFRQALRRVGERFETVTVIEGPSLVPAIADYFVDGVHPNDRGMAEMGKNLAVHLGKLAPGKPLKDDSTA